MTYDAAVAATLEAESHNYGESFIPPFPDPADTFTHEPADRFDPDMLADAPEWWSGRET